MTDKENKNDQMKDKKHEGDEGACPDQDLLPEERCCCSAFQCLASPYVFGVLICLLNFFQAAANAGTGGGVLSTIEKRFQLKTSELAPFLIVNDATSVVMVLFVAYYGHTSHRPRLVGGGGILVGIGLLLCTLPQFIYDTPSQFSITIGRNENNMSDEQHIYPVCQITDATESVCTEDEEKNSGSLMWQVTWIIVGQILVGLGLTPILPLAVTYMDDSLDRTSTSVYVACSFIAFSMGPLLGFGISGFSLAQHADFYKGPVYAQSGDPNWIGAWWLTYAITGLLIIMVSAPIMLFPKKIRRRVKDGKDKEEMEKKSKDGCEEKEEGMAGMYKLDVHKIGEGKCAYVKGFLSAIRRLVTNLGYLSLVFGMCAIMASLAGSLVFKAKYLEVQFSLSSSTAPILLGLILAPGSLFGNLIGGFVVKRLKLTKKGMARMIVILKPVAFILAPLLLVLGCDNRDIAGITAKYPTMNITTLPNLTAGCNSDCACPTDFTPICGSDGTTYATPCHAGCLATMQGKLVGEENGNTTIYTDCSCIGATSQDISLGLSGDYEHVAIPGECPRPRPCNTLIPFVATVMIGALLTNIIGNPAFMLQLRLVDDDDRSIAVGFTSMLLRLLGFIPSPIIFGAVIETACLLHQLACGKTGNCMVYDIVHFRYAYNGLIIALDVLAFALIMLCYISIKGTEQSEALGTAFGVSGTYTTELPDPQTDGKSIDVAAHDEGTGGSTIHTVVI